MPLSVLIVDDSPSFLTAAQTLLEIEGLSVLGTASSSSEAIPLAAQLRPDVMLVDISLAGESGFELARRLTGEGNPGGAVILVSTHAEADFADLIADSPARGFVAKAELSADAIRRILTGASR
jgi:DNA-binding NarL/FixJ family response regulator